MIGSKDQGVRVLENCKGVARWRALPRLVIPGQPMHIVQRGNNRQATFFADEDYRVYLDAVTKAIEKYPVDVHAYVLMINHVHLLLRSRGQSN